MTTRWTTAVSIVLMVVVITLGIANATHIDNRSKTPLSVPLIPTPSIQTTSTKVNTAEVCEQIQYTVKSGDTLESIARQFSISKNDLVDANNRSSEAVDPGKVLVIPLCSSTPTETIYPPTFTTTITPLMDAFSHTPDG